MKSNTNLSQGLNTVATSQKRLPSYRQQLYKKKKMMGVIGIDSIEDDSYQKYLLMYKPSEDPIDKAAAGGAAKKYSLYPFGMSEKLFLPKSEHQHIKEVFKKF
jgi:hypothetical protein